MAEEHTADLWNVNEGDSVTITTTEGEEFDATCTDREVQQSDPRTGEVRQTTMWFFDAVEYLPAASIVDGLRSSDSDPTFPIHDPLWDRQQQTEMGFIESVQIHGPKLES